MFSISDTKKLFRLLATASPTPCPYFELATGTGIVTEKRARAEVVTLIRGAGRTSTFDIANELGLDPKVVGQRLLPTDVDGWGRVGGSTIIKTEEFARLGSALAKELQGVVAVQEFCRGNQIDRELLVRLLPPGCEWLPLGGERECVYDAGYYEGVKAGVLERLRDASKPMELVRLDEKAPSAFLRKVVGDLVREGAFKGVLEADRFVPEVYIRLRQAFLDSARTVFVDKYQARICLQYRGLSGIKDASLKSRLAADLLQFARENGIPAIEKLEMALLEDTSVDLQPLNDLRKVLRQTGAGSPMHCLRDVLDTFKHLEWHSAVEEGLPARKKATMEEINAQLQNSKDLSLALLSTLLLVLAATRDGVVKATGKYVPKLLKEVQNAKVLTADQYDVMEKAKAAAVGKGEVSTEDWEKLRGIGWNCVGRRT